MPKLSNRVKTTVDIHLTGEERLKALHWLNVQHTGAPTMPLDVKCSQEHVDASHRLQAVERTTVELEILKNGDWKIVKIGGRKVV